MIIQLLVIFNAMDTTLLLYDTTWSTSYAIAYRSCTSTSQFLDIILQDLLLFIEVQRAKRTVQSREQA